MTQRKLVFIVDDDYDYLLQLRIHLEHWGYDVETAESQLEAEAWLGKHRPDLAVLDLMMETDDSGFILAYRLKRLYPDVPVIISTAVSAETGMSFDLQSSGTEWIRADLYLEKGTKPEQLKMEIEKLLC